MPTHDIKLERYKKSRIYFVEAAKPTYDIKVEGYKISKMYLEDQQSLRMTSRWREKRKVRCICRSSKAYV